MQLEDRETHSPGLGYGPFLRVGLGCQYGMQATLGTLHRHRLVSRILQTSWGTLRARWLTASLGSSDSHPQLAKAGVVLFGPRRMVDGSAMGPAGHHGHASVAAIFQRRPDLPCFLWPEEASPSIRYPAAH
jgi:hypothetical protein